MSASNKKKLRKELKEEQLTQRQLQEQKESKKLKIITISFIVGLALILVAFLAISIYNTVTGHGLVGKFTTVATIGKHKLTLTDFNYYYVDAVTAQSSEWASQAETYTQYGMTTEEAMAMITNNLDLTKPMTQLIHDETTGQTWADYMVEEALAKAQRDYVLYDAAQAAGFKLSAEDQATLDAMPANLENYAMWFGYGSANVFIREYYRYGEYATVDSFVKYTERSMIADAYYAHYTEQLTYDDAALRANEGENAADYNSYNYAYYNVEVSEFLEGGTKAEDGTVTYSAEEKEAARAKAEAAANDLITADSLESFNDKIAHTFSPELVDHDHGEETTEDSAEPADEETTGTTTEEKTEDTTEQPTEETTEEPTEGTTEEPTEESTDTPQTPESAITSYDVLHSASKQEFREWFAKTETVTGSATVLPIETTTDNADGTSTTEITGYYAVYLIKKSENKTPAVNVRHLLVQVEDTDNEEQWNAAKAEADKLLADWKAGEATEESFHHLVHDNTDDTASAETGGLYEGIHETSGYVDNFLAWCIDPARTEGETGIVKTEYGYHIMYFVNAEKMTYRDQMISDKLRVADAESWLNGLLGKNAVAKTNFDKVNKDMINLQY